MAAVLSHRHRQQVLVQDMLTQRHTVMQDDKIVQLAAAVEVVVVVVAAQQQQVVVLARLLLMVMRMRTQLHSSSVIFVSRQRQVSTDMFGYCRRLTSGPFLLCDATEPTITQCGHLFWCVPCLLVPLSASVVYLPVVVVCLLSQLAMPL